MMFYPCNACGGTGARAASGPVTTIDGSFVAHDRLDAHAAFGKPGDCATEEGDRAGCRQLVEHLGVGEPGVVVDHHVQVLEAGRADHPSLDAAVVLTAAVAEHAVPGAPNRDPAELLDVDVDELPRVAALVPVGRLERLQPGAPPQSEPPQPQRDGR